MTYPPWPTRLLRLFVVLVLTCVVGWYSPLATAAIWHLFHPNGWVNYRGLQVRVPWPWTADTDAVREDPAEVPQGLALKKVPFAANHRSSSESIFVTLISPDPGVTTEQQTAAWMRTFQSTHAGHSFDGRPPIPGPVEAACMRAHSDTGQGEIVWTCISVRGGWVANFEGYPQDEPVFFKIIAHLKK